MNPPFTDPAVTLTDYALAIECAVIVLLLLRREPSDPQLRFWFAVFFASACAASLLGGTVHGFFKGQNSAGRAVLWPATLLAILVTGLSAWFIAAVLHVSEKKSAIIRRLAVVQMAILAFVVLFVTRSFLVAIIAYLPATLFLLLALSSAYRGRKARALGWGIAGLTLTLIAAGVQHLHVAIHRVYFDHNALYHVVQGAALWMIFLAARYISTARPPIRRPYALPA